MTYSKDIGRNRPVNPYKSAKGIDGFKCTSEVPNDVNWDIVSSIEVYVYPRFDRNNKLVGMVANLLARGEDSDIIDDITQMEREERPNVKSRKAR